MNIDLQMDDLIDEC